MTRRVVVVCLAALAMAAGSVRAQDDVWIRLMSEGDAQETAGNYAMAQAAFQKALEASGGTSDERYPLSLNALANMQALLGRFAEAERTYRRALALVETIEGRQTPDFALIQANLALHHAEHGHPDRTEPMLRESIAIYEKTVPADDQRLGLARTCLAGIMLARRRFDDADGLLEQAIAAFRHNGERGKSREAVALNNLGVVRRFQGRNDEAIGLFEESVKLTSQQMGPDHPLLIRSLTNLATLYELGDRHEEARITFERAVAIAEKRLGREHPEYGALLINYAGYLRRRGEKRAAKKLETQGRSVLTDNRRINGVGMTVDISAFQSSR